MAKIKKGKHFCHSPRGTLCRRRQWQLWQLIRKRDFIFIIIRQAWREIDRLSPQKKMPKYFYYKFNIVSSFRFRFECEIRWEIVSHLEARTKPNTSKRSEISRMGSFLDIVKMHQFGFLCICSITLKYVCVS